MAESGWGTGIELRLTRVPSRDHAPLALLAMQATKATRGVVSIHSFYFILFDALITYQRWYLMQLRSQELRLC